MTEWCHITMSIFDSPEFNERMFFPRPDTSAPPADAVDRDVAGLHVRVHERGQLPLLLLFHGNGEVVADYDDQAARFGDAGVNLAVMDYRGYGRSAGTPTFRAMLDDARAVCAALSPQFVMGRSLGSACAAEMYGAAPEGVRGFILESGFVDLDALIRRRGMQPSPLSDEDRTVFDAVPKLARGTTRLLVLHGAEDSMIDPSEAQRAHDAAGTKDKRLVYIAGRGHNDVCAAAAYWAELAGFIRGAA